MQPKMTHSVRLTSVLVLLVAGAQLFAAAPPAITGVSPSRGPTSGGTFVYLNGTGFTGATQVSFGGSAATSFAVQNDTLIQATTPAGAVGVVSVSVVTPEGTATLAEGFGYGLIPIAVDDSYSTMFNTALTVNAPGVLSNDDPNGGGGVVVELGSNVTNGTLTLTDNGGLSYTPNSTFAGTETFTYRSRNNTGFSNFATVRIAVGAPLGPLAPTGLYASEVRGNRVTLRVTLPSIGPLPTALIVEGGPTPGSTASTFVAGPAPLVTFDAPTGLFYVRVRVQSGANVSGPSNEIQLFVNVAAVPSAPENFLSLVDGHALALAWRNSYAGGEPTQLVLDVTGSVVASLVLGFTDNASFTGVPAGTYTVSLRATNAMGSSFPSAPVTVTVPGSCGGAPLAPANFFAYRVGTTIFVIWDPPTSGPAPTSYVLSVTGSFVGSFPTTARSMSGNVGAGSYTISVAAVNACGPSPATVAQTVTIP